jgi:hypothetical protein
MVGKWDYEKWGKNRCQLKVKKHVYQRLTKLKMPDESYGDLINFLVNFYDKHKDQEDED